MTLDEYLKTLTLEQRGTFAKKCGTSLSYLKHVASGIRTPKAALTVNIERETGGLVSCETLCPDVDWSYLRQRA
jgi:DNA-binding transcriptional regulator YdaS (Cro superfamily)